MFRWIKEKSIALWRWNVRQFKSFFEGFFAPFASIAYIFRNPRLLKWSIPPAIITSVLMAVVMLGVFGFTDDVLGWMWVQPAGEVWYETWLLLPLWYLLYVTFLFVLFIVGIIAVYLGSIPLAGPFSELLAEEVEEIETGWAPPFDWAVLARNLLTTALHVGLFSIIQLMVFAVVTVVSFVPVAGQIISLVISLITSPLLVAFVPFDYPMTLRLWGFGDKMHFMFKNFSLFYGFALAAFVMLYIPFVNLIFLPCCVVAATRILVDQERAGTIGFEDKRKAVLARRKAQSSTKRGEGARASDALSDEAASADQEHEAQVHSGRGQGAA